MVFERAFKGGGAGVGAGVDRGNHFDGCATVVRPQNILLKTRSIWRGSTSGA